MKKILFLFLSLVALATNGQNLVRMGTATGTNTYSATFNPVVQTITQTTVYVVRFTNANTSTTCTLDLGVPAAVALKDNSGNDPAIGSIKAGGTYNVIYNGTHLRIVSSVDPTQGTRNLDYVVKTTNYTPVGTDTLTNKVFLMHSTGALTFTIPAASTTNFKKGTNFMVVGDSTGTTTIVAASGAVQLESSGSAPYTLTGDQYAIVSKRNTSNTWDVFIGEDVTGMTNPMTTAADLIVGGSSGTPARLGKGSALQYLRVNSGGTALEYATLSAGGITNSAPNGELMKSDGTNAVASTTQVAGTGAMTVNIDDSGTNSVLQGFGVTRTTSGTPATGIGARVLRGIVETSASNNEIGLNMDLVTTDVTPGSEDFDIVVSLMAAGASASEKFRITSTGGLKWGTTTNSSVAEMTYASSGGFVEFRGKSGGTTNTFGFAFEDLGSWGGSAGNINGAQVGFYNHQTSTMAGGINASNDWYFGPSSSSYTFAALANGNLKAMRTLTAGGTTGAQTINKPTGSVNFAASATSLVVTNSLVSTSSFIFVQIQTNDTNAVIKNVVPGSGSFTINMATAPAAETRVAFWVVN